MPVILHDALWPYRTAYKTPLEECKDDGDCPTNMCLPSLVSKCINFICECTHSMSTD
ncbi:hypothetical protein MtrunA17_Chr5g0420611 [Medicago truncatula]|uniref:Nodule Cysteine-Rich (NCR) secreted peptide n=1 Tax=Medicago truncatula TaxID=3880 RepID=A0A396HUN8_MEDTR|nr:hypothetical protein MtrunA17_Chr5g0420611 [Medicago truncatula]